MQEIINQDQKFPTAVFAASDRIAIGALDCCLDNGLKVPDDISIIGFDDIELATVVRPKLTTIRVDHVELGRKVVELLLAQIKKEEIKPECKKIDFELIERETVKKIS